MGEVPLYPVAVRAGGGDEDAPGGGQEGRRLSHRKYLSSCFRKSTPPHNRQHNILYSNSKQQFDDFMGGATF